MTPKSGLFLTLCCIAAIAAVGSVFELAYGHPRFGETPTLLILLGSIPVAGYLFWAAVQDTRANYK